MRTEPNARLAETMARSGVTSGELADKVGLDPRTIERLVRDSGRVPKSARTREAMSLALDTPVGMLWPTASARPQGVGELVALYPKRAALPGGHVIALARAARHTIDVLALASTWLWDAVPDFGKVLAAKHAGGASVRVCLGDPDGDSARLRGIEGIGELLPARCRLAIGYARAALGNDPEVIRIHDATLYATVLRFDDDLLVNWHLFGAPAADSPVLHVRAAAGSHVAESAIRSVDLVWSRARAIG